MTGLAVHDEPFDRISGEWTGLLSQASSLMPFATPAFQRTWLDHFQDGRRLQLLTARDGERLIGVAPFLRDGATAEFVGHYSICDYMDVVVTPGFEAAFYAPIFERLAADGATTIDLRGLRASSSTIAAAVAAADALGFESRQEPEALSPCVGLPATWDEYLGGLSKKDRHELRRKMRRLSDVGGAVELRAVTAPDESATLLDTLFRLMRVSSQRKEEFLQRPGMEAFFRAMVPAMAREGMLRLYVLTFESVPVASVLNFDLGGTLYMYNSGYDPEYSHFAVGLMSKALLLKDAIENGRTCVDFLRGDEAYKYDLGGKDQQVYRVVLKK